MHLARIDFIANKGDSFFHRARPAAKIFLTGGILASIITGTNIFYLVLTLSFIFLLYFAAGISIVKIGHYAIYPAFFSIIFALILGQGSYMVSLIIILRALGAALILIFLFCTTPYVDLFSVLSKIMPSLLSDIFFFTYRGVFILLHKSQNLIRTIKIRGGFRPGQLLYDLKNTASMLGLLFIQAFNVSERMYQVFALRGYDGFVPTSNYNEVWKKEDYLVLSLGVLVIMGAVVQWIGLLE
ncbi:energy-coupling factor transporter transmembrane component T family protein [Natranaerofaba carboxydovora]|uniref:energy-coupling factor transporter transmembrane component T family protein n=1 Tax=Natranaerofaba carboxydovora TaxID=2742683 RepID=UPI001F148A03|nr:energy-coupling factor transporter transmembrane component T [Natranaerofaba carboxydovora]UMZ74176.1 Cobalt transport protein [Natranaerofaba carboxydovora]